MADGAIERRRIADERFDHQRGQRQRQRMRKGHDGGADLRGGRRRPHLSRRRARRRRTAGARGAKAVDRPLDRHQPARLSPARSSPEAWARLPDRAALAGLEAAAAERYGAPAGSVVAGPGSQALLHVLARLAPARRGLRPRADLRRLWGSVRGRGRRPDRGLLARRARRRGDGHRRQPEQSRTAGSSAAANSLPFMRGSPGAAASWSSTRPSPTSTPGASLAPVLPEAATVALRSFGKTFGLAGLRLGFAVASPDVAGAAARGPRALAGQRPGDRHRRPGARRFGLARGGGRSPRRRRGAARRAARRRRLARRRRDAALPPRRAARRQPRLQAPDGGRNPDPPLRRPPRLAAVRRPGRGGALAPAGGCARGLTPGNSAADCIIRRRAVNSTFPRACEAKLSARLTTRPRPVSRPFFARLLFPCSDLITTC